MIALENIRVFMRAAELGSFSAAGRSLRMSPSVISYRVQALEEHLNCRLVNRTTRRMSLTDAGRVFYEKALEVIASIERAESSVTQLGGAPFGAMRVTAPIALGRQVIASVAVEYRKLYAETEVHLILSDHLLDLVHESVDVAIRMGQLSDSTFTLRKVADIDRVLCASPAYLELHGVPASPADLMQHQCLLLRFPGSQQFRWTLLVDKEPVPLAVVGSIDADDSEILLSWALAGQGIVMLPLFEATRYFASGELVPVLRSFPPITATLGILYPTSRLLPPRVKRFVDMSLDALRAHIARQLSQPTPVSV